MIELFLQKEQRTGPVFGSAFPDGLTIPWRALTMGEFLDIQDRFAREGYPHTLLENEVFKKCVLSQVLVDEMGKLPAGVVSAVAQGIMTYSGPSDLDTIERQLAISRQISGMVIHDMVNLITQGFPAYTPEQIYQLDFETFMLRLAQAERKLMQMGILEKPISFTDKGGKRQPRFEKMPPPEELEKMWREQKGHSSQPSSDKQTIISRDEVLEHQAAWAGHERMDAIILEKQVREHIPEIYGDYIEQLKRGEKVRVQTPEERMAAAAERSKKSKEELKLMIQEEKARVQALEERVSKVKPKPSRKRRRRTITAK